MSPADGVRGAGSSLPGRERLEAAFGERLDGVRLHDGPDARAACEALGTEAYALGDDVAVRGEPTPHMLAHEVAHVVQQRGGGGRPLGEAGLEADAETAAHAVARDGTARVEGRASAGAPQCFRIAWDEETAKGFPRTAAFVRDEMPKMKNDARTVAAFDEAVKGRPRAADWKKGLAWGEGPLIVLKNKKKGHSGSYFHGSEELEVSKKPASEYEKEKDPARDPGHELWLEAIILHEYAHYVAQMEKEPEDVGHAFEDKAYGRHIGDADSNLRHVLRAQFPSGKFSVSVAGSEAGFKQRFTVADAETGNGTYAAAAGTSVSVSKEKPLPLRWNLTIQNDDGRGFKESRIRKVPVSETEWLVRSEDWTDRDFNDLELRVKQTP